MRRTWIRDVFLTSIFEFPSLVLPNTGPTTTSSGQWFLCVDFIHKAAVYVSSPYFLFKCVSGGSERRKCTSMCTALLLTSDTWRTNANTIICLEGITKVPFFTSGRWPVVYTDGYGYWSSSRNGEVLKSLGRMYLKSLYERYATAHASRIDKSSRSVVVSVVLRRLRNVLGSALTYRCCEADEKCTFRCEQSPCSLSRSLYVPLTALGLFILSCCNTRYALGHGRGDCGR